MSGPEDILDLIARLEAATESSRHLDSIIHWQRFDGVGTGYRQDAPAYTASIDAALTLVPEGHDVHVNLYFGRNGEGAAVVSTLKQINLPRTFAPTTALALCIAALKARLPLETDGT